MANITLCKAQDVRGIAPPEDCHIHIVEALPDLYESGLDAAAAHFDQQAEELEVALVNCLPGGTYDRLLGRMLARKASHFRVAFGKD